MLPLRHARPSLPDTHGRLTQTTSHMAYRYQYQTIWLKDASTEPTDLGQRARLGRLSWLD